ncbi:RNA polymerase sigma factor [Paraneptunicella aestuarii]|uniref:RNA polymerase sigma factor n=1 Tax=Paraneptunicella aestuarii TaxID=2831148 RepID=UPI0038CD9A4A
MAEYGAILGRVAASYEANFSLQQELFQEMCLSVWQALQRYQGNSSLKTYVLRVAHNRGVDHVAYQTRQIKPDPFNDEQGNENVSPHRKLQQEDQVARLLRAVRELPVTQRQVVTLSMEGLDYHDIAEVCGLTKSNVGVILNRAKTVLMQRVKSDE